MVLLNMDITFDTILYLGLAGTILFAGVFILRFMLKFAWKLIRVALILISVLLVAGYFLGFLDRFFG